MFYSKFIASRGRIIVEFFLIVLGVLAALMVDTWMGERQDDNLRQEYMTRLADDLETDRQSLDYRISFYSAVRDFGIETLNRIQSDSQVEQEAILAAYYASELFLFRSLENTYEDMQSTGNIRLLADIELRLALASYYRKISAEATDTAEDYRRIVRGIIPWKIQAAIREHCPTIDEIGEIPTGFPPCKLPGVSNDEVNEVFQSLRTHPVLVNVLTFRVSDVDTSIYLFKAQKQTALSVLALL